MNKPKQPTPGTEDPRTNTGDPVRSKAERGKEHPEENYGDEKKHTPNSGDAASAGANEQGPNPGSRFGNG